MPRNDTEHSRPSIRAIVSAVACKPINCVCCSRCIIIKCLFIIFSITGCQHNNKSTNSTASGQGQRQPAAVEIRRTATGGYLLYRYGQRFRIRGGAGTQHFDKLRAAGGNSVRLYTTDYAGPLLDEAQRQGLTVMLGLWMQPEWMGFDYYDTAAVQRQLADLRKQILRYRHHPALLMWCIGNEMDLGAQNRKAFGAINQVAELIHELDPDHPVTTAITGTLTFIPDLKRWAPAVDILSVNSFGALRTLPADIRRYGWNGPYIVSEFGSRGYWAGETMLTPWKAPLEHSSTQRATFMLTRYQKAVLGDSAHCLGAYALYWGQKVEGTPTWFSLFTSAGEATASVDELHRLWRGHYPANRAPQLQEMRLGGRRDIDFPRLRPNTFYEATFQAQDPEGQPLSARWEIWPELRPDDSIRLAPREPLMGYISEVAGNRALMRTPAQPGAYRLFLWVSDGHGGAATANIPFYCAPPVARRQPEPLK